jgi:hypothetical protein
MDFSASIFMKLLISYKVFISGLSAKFYPKLKNIFLYNVALVKVKKIKQSLYRTGQTLRVPGV